MNEPGKLIPQHGGYRKLTSFQVAQLAYVVTARFCERQRRDIFVESEIKANLAPSGAAYSVLPDGVAPDGACFVRNRQATTMSALTGFGRQHEKLSLDSLCPTR
jgi:hypothetical protein